jgi:hypothetical protein
MREAAGRMSRAHARLARQMPHWCRPMVQGQQGSRTSIRRRPAQAALYSPLLISEGLVGRSLPQLRQDALSTSALAHGAAGRAHIVSPLLISPVSSPACEETRATV